MEELLEAAKKAEAVEAHRTWAQLLAERVAATSASKRLKPSTAAADMDAATAQALLSAALPQAPPLQTQTHPGATQSSGYSLPLSLDFAALGLPVPPPPRVASAPTFPTEPPSALPSDSEDGHNDHIHSGDGGGAPSRRGRGVGAAGTRTRAARDPLTRAEATKEKNRRAQQRFRHKQKSRMEALEAEVVRLRALLAERGGDPGDALPDPEAAYLPQHTQQQHVQINTAPSEQQQQHPPSLDAMHADLEAWLEAAEGVARPAAVRFLQGWTEMADDARRLHYRSLAKRRAAGDVMGVALWVNTQVESRVGGGTSTPGEGASPRGVGSGGSGGASEQAAPLPAQRMGAAALTAALPQVASR